MFGRFFGRVFSRSKDEDSILPQDGLQPMNLEEVIHPQTLSYLEYVAYLELFGDHDDGIALKEYMGSEARSVDEIIQKMGWSEKDYTKGFLERYFIALDKYVVGSDNRYKLKPDVAQPSQSAIDQAMAQNKQLLLGGEDLLKYSPHSLKQGSGAADFEQKHVGVVWNSVFECDCVNAVRRNSICLGLDQFDGSKQLSVLMINAKNGRSSLELLQEAKNRGISINLTVVEPSSILMNLTRRRINPWLYQQKKDSSIRFVVEYEQEEVLEFFDRVGAQFDLIVYDYAAQHLEVQEYPLMIEKIHTNLTKSGVLVTGNIPNKPKYRPLELIFNNAEVFNGFPDFNEMEESLKHKFRKIINKQENMVIIAIKE